MPDIVINGFIANLASDLTLGVLRVLNRRLREAIEGSPRHQALRRCFQAATKAFLPEDDPASETYRPILQDFFAQPAVQAELAKLIRGREPDQETLVEFFTEAKYYVADLPSFNFPARLATAVEAFLEAAQLESELVQIIQTAQLRDIAANLRQITPDVKVMRQALEQHNQSTLLVPQNTSPALRKAVEALDSTSHEVRKSSIRVIAKSSDPVAFEILILAVKRHPIFDVRANALYELAQFNNPDMIPSLIEVLNDEWSLWNTAFEKLARFGPTAIPELLNALSHQNPKVRYGAVVALDKIGDPATVPNLVKALHDKNANVRCGAAEALGKIGDTSTISALAELLSDTTEAEWEHRRVCDVSSVALQQIGTPEALAARGEYTGMERISLWRVFTEKLYILRI